MKSKKIKSMIIAIVFIIITTITSHSFADVGSFESYDSGYLYGYTPNYIKVKVKGDESLWGKQVPVKLYSKEEELMLGSI